MRCNRANDDELSCFIGKTFETSDGVGREINPKSKVKGVGQGCATHTSLLLVAPLGGI
jgi:hypothetical protein